MPHPRKKLANISSNIKIEDVNYLRSLPMSNPSEMNPNVFIEDDPFERPITSQLDITAFSPQRNGLSIPKSPELSLFSPNTPSRLKTSPNIIKRKREEDFLSKKTLIYSMISPLKENQEPKLNGFTLNVKLFFKKGSFIKFS